METFDAIRTVLAVRRFKDTPIPEPIVRQIVEAAHLTASSQNGQPWHFIVVQDKETLRQLGQLARTGPYIPQAPLAIVVAMDRSPFAISDGSRAIQDMILAAWSQGIGSNWVGFSSLPQVNPLLGIPEEVSVLAIVPFGYQLMPSGEVRRNVSPWARLSIMNDGENHSSDDSLRRVVCQTANKKVKEVRRVLERAREFVASARSSSTRSGRASRNDFWTGVCYDKKEDLWKACSKYTRTVTSSWLLLPESVA